jgi:hypothetical protein
MKSLLRTALPVDLQAWMLHSEMSGHSPPYSCGVVIVITFIFQNARTVYFCGSLSYNDQYNTVCYADVRHKGYP